ncbi:helix-turn-helix domain-containing protein [Ureibacillus chungkukjangi]|uniref:helix-turn-helix domain-containing protein n=1 Tax=Ureibacillus chungkukjangi TaxID=1202712 RepID=UPI00203D2BD3|nr:helix-turn-helix transcriptional regulator [Ureibacillus chungkukjangi]MCM3390236.1 helix-turn-helix domain-containing protein [Ureibacillus chungkukjangi]
MRKVRSINENFSSMLKHLREKKSLSLKKMEDITGISASYISRMENGERVRPSYPVIELLAFALSVEPSDLLEVSSNTTNRKVVPLEQLLFSCEFTLDGVSSVDSKTIECLLNLIDVINDVEWERDSLIADIYEVTEAVADLKNVLKC